MKNFAQWRNFHVRALASSALIQESDLDDLELAEAAAKGVTQGSCEEFWNILPDGVCPDAKDVDGLVA